METYSCSGFCEKDLVNLSEYKRTYDCVSNPSYSNARILELLPESLNDFISPDQELLYEDSDELNEFMEKEKVHVNKNSNDVALFLDQVINENYKNIIMKKIMFSL